MTDSKVFCIVPWFEVHVNADGSYHTCGAQPNFWLSDEHRQEHNINSMSIETWVNSEYQKRTRLDKLSGTATNLCSLCYHEDEVGSSSKRVRENLKCNIDSRAFESTYANSPAKKIFDYSNAHQGVTDVRPTNYHISLGNECNLACRMCSPSYSSKIASELSKTGAYAGPIRMNWTDNQHAWDNLVEYMCDTENLEFVHIVGGEPMLSSKFEDLVDRLIAAKRTNIYFGFTTNGTIVKPRLLEKLNSFRQVDIGVSVECMGILNNYIRRGSEYTSVLSNLETYLTYKNDPHVYITLRIAPSALSVHTLIDLYKWSADRELDVMSNMLTRPNYLQIRHLPEHIKQALLLRYEAWEFTPPLPGDSDPRDPNRFKEHIDNEIQAVITSLRAPADPTLTEQLYSALSAWGWLDNHDLKNYFL